MVSNKVLLGCAGRVIRGSGFSKYRESESHSHAYYESLFAHGSKRECMVASPIRDRLERTSSRFPYVRLSRSSKRVRKSNARACTSPRLAGLLDAEGKDTAGRGHH